MPTATQPDAPIDTVLLTGATGFLGTRVAHALLELPGTRVLALVRTRGTLGGAERLARLWHDDPLLMGGLRSGRVTPLEGDITWPLLGLSGADLALVASEATAVVHTAADVNINQTAEALHAVNVDGTRHLLDVARLAHAGHGLRRVVYVSTSYVAGARQGTILEDELVDAGFSSLYEATKFEAEALVREAMADLPISVVRPAQIVGDSRTGEVDTFNTVYYPLKMYLRGKMRVMPVSSRQKLNVVPVDYVVQVLMAALTCDEAAGVTYHAVLPPQLQPTVGQIMVHVRAWAADNMDLRLPRPVFVPAGPLARLGTRRNLRHDSAPKRKGTLANMLALAPYFCDTHVFDTTHTSQLLGPCTLDWQQFFDHLLRYAVDRGFLNHTGRTVFEQMQVRLASQRNRMAYHDIGDGYDRVTEPAQMRTLIRQLAAAMLARGVSRGDRVALVGVNSVAYAAADSAIGLIGATSVPLYYTAPVTEVRDLVARSRARLLLVGTPKLAAAAIRGELGDIPCVLLPQAGNPLAGDKGTVRLSSPAAAPDRDLDKDKGDKGTVRLSSPAAAPDRELDKGDKGDKGTVLLSSLASAPDRELGACLVDSGEDRGASPIPRNVSSEDGTGNTPAASPEFEVSVRPTEDDKRTVPLSPLSSTTSVLPVVSAADQADAALEVPLVTGWDEWLALGKANQALLDQAPAASLDDVATIRYTSGTTGAPKGVTFTQAQLEWMGRTMPAILDWHTRTSHFRYLSFLPMSHVVEGILVAYAPHFALVDADVYCLNDFSQLTSALPQVRPTVFFSVPRFYEKMWAQFASSGAGRRYLAMSDGPLKRAFGRLCRRVVLKKAGLDRCRQLIVGSAPIRDDLLRDFRELGIEIHNAYGLTEAPLITLNRLGGNDLGSLGQALPETDLRVDEDGQIWMRGPQLTHGYDGMDARITDEQGFFATGDLGRWSPDGNLVIDGRRKELVVTSYGKNVQPEKVEALLKGVPGVSEAVLVGDARPYCCALVWLEDEARAGFDATAFDAGVAALAERLSHPEMPKRWAVLDGSPAISTGELTPNLKLRRAAILERQAAVVEALYARDAGAAAHLDGVLHEGAWSQ